MTERELKQLRYLETEISLLQQEYDNLVSKFSEVTDAVSGSEQDYPYLKRTITIRGLPFGLSAAERDICRPQLTELAQLLARYKRAYIALRYSLTEQIAEIPDSEMRVILTLRYIEGYTWPNVAAKIGGAATGDTVRMQCKRFLKTCSQCSESR